MTYFIKSNSYDLGLARIKASFLNKQYFLHKALQVMIIKYIRSKQAERRQERDKRRLAQLRAK
jgi:hypothetical protein